MPYLSPGAYARFQHTASAVTSVGSTRIMALVGTGNSYFQVTNEGHDRNKDRIYDMLFHENIFEVQAVSSKAIYEGNSNPDNVIYTEGIDYELKDGDKIVWRTIQNSEPNVDLQKVDTDPFINEGSRAFYSRATYQIDSAHKYFVEDGVWSIEVTYAAEEAGCYRIINRTTNDVVGEYVVGDEFNTAIPGVLLKITSTFKRPSDADAESDENLIAAGDYFVLKTTAAKTEKEPTAAINTATSVVGLKDSVKSIEVFTKIPFINLQRLDLEFNQISNIESFIKSPFINLMHLGLRDNHLDEHESDTAKIIKELKEKYKNIDLVLSQPEYGPLLKK